MRKIHKLALIIIMVIFNSCLNMENQAELIIGQHKIELGNDLKELQQENIISDIERKQLEGRLNQDLDYFLLHKDIDTTGIKNLFNATINSFENIKINQPVFYLIMGTYYQIASRRMMKDYPQIDMSYQTYTNNLIYNWFDNYQTQDDKFNDLIYQVTKEKKMALYPEITPAEYDTMISTIVKIKNDTTIPKNVLKQILIDGMNKHANKNNDANLSILNIYGDIDRLKGAGAEKDLLEIYETRVTEPKELSYEELKQEVEKYCSFMLDEGLVSRSDYKLCIKTVISDIEFCENNNDKKDVKNRLLSGLRKLKFIFLETEDRETVAHWYFTLSQKRDIDISSDLNNWLYK